MNRRTYLSLVGCAGSVSGCLGAGTDVVPGAGGDSADPTRATDDDLPCSIQDQSTLAMPVEFNTKSFLLEYPDESPIVEIVLGDETVQRQDVPETTIRNTVDERVPFSLLIAVSKTEESATETSNETSYDVDFHCELPGGASISVVPSVAGEYQIKVTTDGGRGANSLTVNPRLFRAAKDVGCTFTIHEDGIDSVCGGPL